MIITNRAATHTRGGCYNSSRSYVDNYERFTTARITGSTGIGFRLTMKKKTDEVY